MPELPEVETVRRGLEPVLISRRLVRIEARRRDLRFPLPDDFALRLQGRRVLAIGRQAKFLLFTLDDGFVWLAHLGMSGAFHIGRRDTEVPADSPARVHDHLLIETDDGATVVFHDPRRFGFMDLIAGDALGAHPMLARLGPDPLGPAFTDHFLRAQLARRTAPLKAVLLDQSVVAGMGNIYASESLFRAGLSPTRVASAVTGRRVGRLAAAIGAVFEDAIAGGGATLRDYRQPSGELGCFQHAFAVYGRVGEPCPGCRCDVAETGGIGRIVQSGRSTYYCERRQR